VDVVAFQRATDASRTTTDDHDLMTLFVSHVPHPS
jgi:hypothetical protein